MPHTQGIRRVLLAGVLALAVAPASAAAAGEPVQIWLTTTSGSGLAKTMSSEPSRSFASGDGSGQAVNVDPGTTYQAVDGFGGSMTDSAASLIYSSPQRDAIMRDLFGADGATYSYLRVPMGASDLSRSNYSYDDSCCDLSDFSVGHDAANIIPLLQQAKQLSPQLKLIASPWSAPGWMKQGGSFVGNCSGTLNSLKSAYTATWADYFARFVKAYKDTYELPVDAVTLQNEPHNCDPTYATMTMEPGDASDFALKLRGALNSAGHGEVKIVGWDHNWYDNGGPATYPQSLLSYNNGQALNAIDGIAYHCYVSPDGSYSVQSDFHNAYPSKGVYFTECSGGTWAPNTADNLVWNLQNVLIGPLRNWARTSIYWSLALDPDNGPSVGGCRTCRGMITVDNRAGTYTKNGEYYAWAHLSKVVHTCATRIGSPDFGSGGIQTVAFKNPDGTLALVALNSNRSNAASFQIDWAGQSVDYTLPAGSVASFKWNGTTSGGPGGGTGGDPGGGTGGGTTPGDVSSGWYALVNQHSLRCLDARDWGTGNGTAVQQWACGSGQRNQQWRFVPTDGGYYRVVSRNAPGEVLDVSGGPGAAGDGVPIQLWSWAGGTNQQWKPVALANGDYELVARHSGRCLDVPGASTGDGARLQQYGCNGTGAQAVHLVQQS
jgi:glucosylceramidase